MKGINDTLAWIENNKEAEVSVLEAKQKELTGKLMPMVQAVSQGAAGGAGGSGGFSGGGDAPPPPSGGRRERSPFTQETRSAPIGHPKILIRSENLMLSENQNLPSRKVSRQEFPSRFRSMQETLLQLQQFSGWSSHKWNICRLR
jgi:hypothetical protein